MSTHHVNKQNNDNPDECLVEAALTGDDQAFDQLYNRYQKRVLAICLQYSHGDLALAKDMRQEAFIKAFSKLSSLREHAHFYAWLSEIARNKCISHVRKQGTLHKALFDYEVVNEVMKDKEQKWSEAELQVVENLIEGIEKEDLKETIRLFYVEGKNSKEIAAIQGVAQSTITTRLDRFRSKFRKRIAREIMRVKLLASKYEL